MNKLELFKNESFGEIRTLLINDEVWFVGKDVAEALGYAEPRSAISKKVDEEDRGVAKMETPSGKQEMTIINESGLYFLILSSKLPQAKEFKRWVTKEVLPTLRKTGYYIARNELEEIKAKAQLERAEAMKINAEVRKLQELNRMTCNDLVISKEGFYTLERIKKRNARLFKNQIFQKLQEIYDLINEFDYID